MNCVSLFARASRAFSLPEADDLVKLARDLHQVSNSVEICRPFDESNRIPKSVLAVALYSAGFVIHKSGFVSARSGDKVFYVVARLFGRFNYMFKISDDTASNTVYGFEVPLPHYYYDEDHLEKRGRLVGIARALDAVFADLVNSVEIEVVSDTMLKFAADIDDVQYGRVLRVSKTLATIFRENIGGYAAFTDLRELEEFLDDVEEQFRIVRGVEW